MTNKGKRFSYKRFEHLVRSFDRPHEDDPVFDADELRYRTLITDGDCLRTQEFQPFIAGEWWPTGHGLNKCER